MKEIEQAEMKWNRERPGEYELTVVRGYNNPGPYVSVVRGVNILRSRGGYRPSGRDIAPTLRTVEGLFAEAYKATMFPAHEVHMTFDERFGYLTHLRIDLSKGSSGDDEITLDATVKVIVP